MATAYASPTPVATVCKTKTATPTCLPERPLLHPLNGLPVYLRAGRRKAGIARARSRSNSPRLSARSSYNTATPLSTRRMPRASALRVSPQARGSQESEDLGGQKDRWVRKESGTLTLQVWQAQRPVFQNHCRMLRDIRNLLRGSPVSLNFYSRVRLRVRRMRTVGSWAIHRGRGGRLLERACVA